MIVRSSWKTVVIASLAMGLLGLTVQSATTANILIDGAIPDSKVFEGPVRVTVRELTLKPGEALPLHYHPGHVFIAVKSGTLTVAPESTSGGMACAPAFNRSPAALLPASFCHVWVMSSLS